MRMEVHRREIRIIPENDEDTAYIEEVLKLNEDGKSCDCERVNAYNLHSIAFVGIRAKVSE